MEKNQKSKIERVCPIEFEDVTIEFARDYLESAEECQECRWRRPCERLSKANPRKADHEYQTEEDEYKKVADTVFEERNKRYGWNKKRTYELLQTGGFMFLNYNLTSKLGPKAATYLTRLLYSYVHFYEKGNIPSDDWFFSTHKFMEEKIGLSHSAQRTVEEKLEAKFLIETKLEDKKGNLPKQKKWFKINFNKIKQLIEGV